MSLPDADVAIIGGGIVGLAAAHAVARIPGTTVAVLEKEYAVATHQSGRNSGVIHSGVYYAPASKKAAFVASGRRELIDFCEDAGIDHRICGKVIVATTNDDITRLGELARRAGENDVDAALVGPRGLADIEPHATGRGALVVPSAGVVDFGRVAGELRRNLERHGTVLTGAEVTRIEVGSSTATLHTALGSRSYRHVINCAGLQADRVAALCGVTTDLAIVPFRGEYFALSELSAPLVRHLIYPVPDERYPFLGVHLSRSIDGEVHAGPNAVLALAREGYRRSDVDLGDVVGLARSRAMWKLGARHWRTGANEIRRSFSARLFLRDLRRLVPDIPDDALTASPAGVRAQALGPDGSLVDDFVIVGHGPTTHVLNAPSPAATASFAIGRAIAQHYLTARTKGS